MNVYGRNGTYDEMTVGVVAAKVNGTRIDYTGTLSIDQKRSLAALLGTSGPPVTRDRL